MEKKFSSHFLHEVIYGSSDTAVSKKISKLEKAGKIRKIAPRLYTSNLEDAADTIVRRNLFQIIGNLYPGALLSHRSALEFQPTSTGKIFLTYSYSRKVHLPGVTLRFMKGPAPVEGDSQFSDGLYVSQRERAFLENLQESRIPPGPDSKSLPLPQLEERLEKIVSVNGEDELNEVRDKARKVADLVGMQKEFNRLDKIIAAILQTKPASNLKSPLATARAFGLPYDAERIALFEQLFRELRNYEFRFRKDRNTSRKAFKNFAFFESYFSNYIEGTVFEIEEAKQIIRSQTPLPARNEDSHDILGTYHIVADKDEMMITPQSGEELMEILQNRHHILLGARVDKKPGKFKDKANFAGQTVFVDPALVRGTLVKSFDYYNILEHPFAKAAYIMFVISEVHPFLDGNGRIARVMMNAELVKGNQAKLIIPTVYRDDYLGALRRLTRRHDTDPYIRMLMKAHQFSAAIVGEEMDEMQRILEKSEAFLEHTEGKLRMPGD